MRRYQKGNECATPTPQLSATVEFRAIAVVHMQILQLRELRF